MRSANAACTVSSRYPRWVAGGVVAWLLVTGIGLAGDPLFNSLEFVRFSAPVGLPGVTLVAGEYSFEAARANGIDVVRVRSRRSNRVTFLGPVQRIARPRRLSLRRSIVLGDAGPGEVAPIVAWFPIDELIGYQFTYPASQGPCPWYPSDTNSGIHWC